MTVALIDDVLDKLEDLGHSSEVCDSFGSLVKEGFASKTFAGIIGDFVAELGVFVGYIGTEATRGTPEGLIDFLRHHGGFPAAITVEDLKTSADRRTQLVDFLLCELQACRMVHAAQKRRAAASASQAVDADQDEKESKESQLIDTELTRLEQTAKEPSPEEMLHHLCDLLHLEPDPSGVSTLERICEEVQRLKDSMPKGYTDSLRPLLKRADVPQQHMRVLADIHTTFKQDYTTRRHMLLKRLHVTLQSLLWSERAKDHEEDIRALLRSQLSSVPLSAAVALEEVFCAGRDLLIVRKVTGVDVSRNTQCRVKRTLIGKVPDRGGRTGEQRGNSMPAMRKRGRGEDWQRKAAQRAAKEDAPTAEEPPGTAADTSAAKPEASGESAAASGGGGRGGKRGGKGKKNGNRGGGGGGGGGGNWGHRGGGGSRGRGRGRGRGRDS